MNTGQGQSTEEQLLSELETLYPRIERSIRAYTNGTGLDPRDLTQDAFLKAVKSLDQYNQGSALYTWIFRIARNTCIDAMRKLKIRRQYDASDVDADNQSGDPGEQKSDFEQREEQNMVRRVMASMPDHYRELIILKDFEGMQYNEIAVITGVQEGTVKSRLFRARVMLKDGLLKAGYVHES